MGLEEDFKQAVDDISNKINKTMTDEELKEIYALYKQATVGDINVDRYTKPAFILCASLKGSF